MLVKTRAAIVVVAITGLIQAGQAVAACHSTDETIESLRPAPVTRGSRPTNPTPDVPVSITASNPYPAPPRVAAAPAWRARLAVPASQPTASNVPELRDRRVTVVNLGT